MNCTKNEQTKRTNKIKNKIKNPINNIIKFGRITFLFAYFRWMSSNKKKGKQTILCAQKLRCDQYEHKIYALSKCFVAINEQAICFNVGLCIMLLVAGTEGHIINETNILFDSIICHGFWRLFFEWSECGNIRPFIIFNEHF